MAQASMPPATRAGAPASAQIPLRPAAQSAAQSVARSAARSARPPAREVVMRLQQVNKVYDNGCPALVDVNLQIRKGDFIFITGPSGSGKSTLLKLLYGEERCSEGEVFVHDVGLNDLRGNRLSYLRRQIGVVFQDYKLIPRRTVSENVAFVLSAQGFSRKEIQRRLLPTLKMVGLQDKADCFPEQLSGGEQQRVSLARAVVSTPPILLADEPTGNLDPENSWQVLKILQKLNSIGITVVVTTHDEQLVKQSEHPVLQIRNGKLFQMKR
jgi:cell division transport system ATP-binding protein